METNTTATRVVAIACASALVVASAGFGSVYAYRIGIEHSPLLAFLSVLMAVALEIIKPIAVSSSISSLGSWNLSRGVPLALLAMVCITYSLTSELSLMATTRGDLVAHRQAKQTIAQDSVARRERLEMELKALGLLRPAIAVQGELKALLSDSRLKNCEGVLSQSRLRDICINKIAPLKVELAKAQRREIITTELNGLQTIKTDSPGIGNADPGSTALATYLGSLGLSVQVPVLSQWLALVPVLALELGSALALLAMPAKEPPAVQLAVSPIRDTLRGCCGDYPAPLDETREPAGTKEGVCLAVLEAVRASNGSLEQSERALAKRIGANRSSTRRAIRYLAASGMLIIDDVSRTGTALKLPPSSLGYNK